MSSFIVKSLRNSIKSQRTFFEVTVPKAFFSSKGNANYENDLAILKGFQSASAANADGCIHIDNAEALFNKIKAMAVPGNEYPQGRKHIVAYARTEYKWADGADAAFKKGMIAWSTERRAAARLIKLEKATPK